jgi:hypothetical protein
MFKRIKRWLTRKPIPKDDPPCAECGLRFVDHFGPSFTRFKHPYRHPEHR